MMPTAEALLAPLVGRTISTIQGRPNEILALTDRNVVVGTARSPRGAPVRIALVQQALDRLAEDGEIEISVKSLGHRRSSFIGAVLLTLPGVSLASASPPRVALPSESPRAAYREEVAGRINAWWRGDPSQIFWLEITDRPDIGVDLHAPQRDAGGALSPGYSLIWWVEPGDAIFHYDRNERAIVSWSRASGSVSEAPVVWLSHRGTTRRRLRVPRSQPGWWLDLEGPFPLSEPVTLADLRAAGEEIRRVLDELRERYAGSLYFPFFFHGGTELRPMQPYLNKLPAEMVRLVPRLDAAAGEASSSEVSLPASESAATPLGAPYRPARVSVLPDRRDPFTVDPALIERGLRGHAETQNALAYALESAGSVPLSPRAGDPNFDLAWAREDVVYVAEVKSITAKNEEQQLRLGLGQVLRYRHLLARQHADVRALLVVEREPRDPSWRELCDALGVSLLAPTEQGELLVPGLGDRGNA